MAQRKVTEATLRGKRFAPQEKTFLKQFEPGLYLRVSPSGGKSFVTLYTFDGKQRWLTIGRFPAMSLATARRKLEEIQRQIAEGKDPQQAKLEAKAQRIKAPTVQEFAEVYLKKWAEPNKKSAKEDRRILEKDVIPRWGKRKLAAITRPEIITLLDEVATRGPIIANRTLAVIRKMFNFAVKRGVLELSPCQHIDAPGKEVSKDRVLSFEEIKALWTVEFSDITRHALLMILATAQRPGEVAAMRWEEISGDWWTIPAEKAKNGNIHRVFLNDIAKSLLGPIRKRGFVFPSRIEGQAINPNALARALRQRKERIRNNPGPEAGLSFDFTPHDLRRTAASHMASLGTPRRVIAKLLNHAEHDVTAVYDRYGYDREKQIALESWGRKLNQVIHRQKTDNILPINKRHH